MAPSMRCPPLRQSVALLPERSLRAIAGPRSPERQYTLLQVAAVPRMVMAQSGVQANGLAKLPLPLADLLADPLADLLADPLADLLADPLAGPLADPLADPLAGPPQISPARRGFLEC